MTTGVRLREERERLQLDQETFAGHGGVRRFAQSNYENGKRLPDAGYLAGIAEIGADVLYIVTGRRAISLEQLASEVQQMADAWETLERGLLAVNRELDIQKKRKAAEALYETAKSAQLPREQLVELVMKLVA